MTDAQQKAAAKQFVKDWAGRGDEKQETQLFWISLLQNVYGIEQPTKAIEFEVPVKLSHTSFIDGYIKDTRVLVEQKGADIDLKKGYKQSDGSMQTPYQQARRYAGYLPHNMNPRWIVVCNFKEFHIHDMNRPNDTPEIVLLKDLEQEFHRLQFLVDVGNDRIQKEMQVSLQAGELVGKLYDSLLKQYKDPESPSSLKSLNMLCVRLVFCLYAEDADIFGKRNLFHDYLKDVPASGMRRALVDLFRILDTKAEARDPYLADDNPMLAAFPYVNGGLFADESIEIPPFTEELKNLLLTSASENFNWAEISPTIFGAVFESTLNPKTRRSGGMHYTSIENIHKVIDPLFLNGLKAELEEVRNKPIAGGSRSKAMEAFHNKLGTLTFLDPACGSGNFLTETYLSLRRLENEIINEIFTGDAGQLGIGAMAENVLDTLKVKVSIGQFYGIEINDFAVTVARTALWIAESQMLKETEEIVHMHMDFLPLTAYANIVEGNALQVDWKTVVPANKLNYIMGNPPFVGASMMSAEQKAEAVSIFGKIKLSNSIDYVGAWYYKAAELLANTSIRAAFVSTNSITQGEQVAPLWGTLYSKYRIHIDFAYRTFRWDSEASAKAHVHCVIIGFSATANQTLKYIYTHERVQIVQNISPYLIDGPTVFIASRSKPICDVPPMYLGNKPSDGGNLILSAEERLNILSHEPYLEKYIRPYIGAVEFINRKERYCFWLTNASPSDLRNSKELRARLEAVRKMRMESTATPTREKANTPHLFFFISQPTTNYLLVPSTSSENRRYIPIGFLPPDTIASNAATIVPNATLLHFGVLTSNVHMAWMRAVCGRLKSDYRYSGAIVYNNFPWPNPTAEQKAKIEQTAQAILDARALYPDCSLADLYDEVTMPPELRKAHQQNDKAVMQAYGFWNKLNTETECVAELMKMYQELTK